MATEMADFFPANGEYFAYFDPAHPATFTKALDDLSAYLTTEGPFDGILAYSHGAQLAASFFLQPGAQRIVPASMRCLVFLSGGIPYGLAPDASVQHLQPGAGSSRIELPVANIWGRHDALYPGASEALSRFCRPDSSTVFVHEGGHNVPGTNAEKDLLGCVRAVRRTIDLALWAQ